MGLFILADTLIYRRVDSAAVATSAARSGHPAESRLPARCGPAFEPVHTLPKRIGERERDLRPVQCRQPRNRRSRAMCEGNAGRCNARSNTGPPTTARDTEQAYVHPKLRAPASNPCATRATRVVRHRHATSIARPPEWSSAPETDRAFSRRTNQ